MRTRQYLSVIIIITFIFTSSSCKKDSSQVAGTSDNTNTTQVLNDLVTKIQNHEYGGTVHSLIIAKNDSIVFEKYFNGYNRNQKHLMYSVTKSFVSALIGICIDKGLIENTNVKAIDYFPDMRATVINSDSTKADISLDNLLTMTAGFKWDEWSASYASSDNQIAKMIQSSDWIKYVFMQPMAHTPGTYATYNSGVSHILSGIVTKAAHKSTKDFARENLFTPLGITDFTWDSNNQDMTIGGWGLSLRPVDMIKFGELYLHNGKYNNQQVISESWVQRSTYGYHSINQWCTYGYQFWRYGSNTGSLYQNKVFFCSGRGEQYIWVIPTYNAVVVCTAWNDGQSLIEPVLREYILGALANWK